jgi:hypothetical protein
MAPYQKFLETRGEEAGKTHTVFDSETGEAIPVTGSKFQEIAAANSAGKSSEVAGRPVTAEISPQAKANAAVLDKFNTDRSAFFHNYARSKEALESLAQIYQAYRSGRGAGDLAEISSWAARFGINLPQSWAAGNFDAATKTAVLQAIQQMSEQGLQRAPRTGLLEVQLTTPRPENDPAANYKIITEALASLDYSNAMYKEVATKAGKMNVTKGISDFNDTHDFDKDLAGVRGRVHPFKGMTPDSYTSVLGAPLQKIKKGQTPPAGWKEGDVFDPLNPNARWDASGNQE